MPMWRREYPNGAIATVMPAPSGIVVVFLWQPKEECALVEVVDSLDQAQAVADQAAGAGTDAAAWTRQET
jgi:hypothetical protein